MRNHDRIIALFFVILGLYIVDYSIVVLKVGTIRNPESGFISFVTGLILVILGAIWATTVKANKLRAVKIVSRGDWKRLLSSLGLMLGYAMAFQPLGYLSSTVLFVGIWQYFLEKTNWQKSVLITLLSTGGMYLLFGVLLKIPLPSEIFLR